MSDLENTVGDGEEGPLEDREAQNHGAVKNGLSGQKPVPSAPPSCFARRASQDRSGSGKQDALRSLGEGGASPSI